MNENLINNRPVYYKEKIDDYKKFCERICLVKSNCNPKPPQDYPFLRYRLKKKVMEKERQENIDYNIQLLLKKYKSMYKNHNKYHPSNIKFQPHPSSLKFSTGRPQYYELVNNNIYLGNKIKQIQKSNGLYNSQKSIDHYKKMKKIGEKFTENSLYGKQLLNLVTPLTYEKRLNRVLGDYKNKSNQRGKSQNCPRPKTGINLNNMRNNYFYGYGYNTNNNFYRYDNENYYSNFPKSESNFGNYSNNYKRKRILIEREDEENNFGY